MLPIPPRNWAGSRPFLAPQPCRHLLPQRDCLHLRSFLRNHSQHSRNLVIGLVEEAIRTFWRTRAAIEQSVAAFLRLVFHFGSRTMTNMIGADFFQGDAERGDAECGAGRRDQTYQVPAVLIPSEAED